MRKGWSWACHRLPGPVPGKIPCWVPSKTTSPLPSPWLGLFRLRGGKPRFFCHIIIVRFPNPLAPDIQIHVSWGIRLAVSCHLTGCMSSKGISPLAQNAEFLIMGTWQRKSGLADGRGVSGADEPQMASRIGGRSAIKERRSIKKTCAKSIHKIDT